MYDATQGRFLQRDPLGLGLGISLPTDSTYESAVDLPQNLYEYASDNPTDRIDPLGLIDWSKAERIREYNVDVNGKLIRGDLYRSQSTRSTPSWSGNRSPVRTCRRSSPTGVMGSRSEARPRKAGRTPYMRRCAQSTPQG